MIIITGLGLLGLIGLIFIFLVGITFSTLPIRALQFVMQNRGFVAEGFSGSLNKGFVLDQIGETRAAKKVLMSNLNLRYSLNAETDWKRLRFYRLSFDKLDFQEQDLEKLSRSQLESEIYSALAKIDVVKAKPGSPMVSIDVIDLRAIAFQPTPNEEVLRIDWIVVKNLIFSENGLAFSELEIKGPGILILGSKEFLKPANLKVDIEIPAALFDDGKPVSIHLMQP